METLTNIWEIGFEQSTRLSCVECGHNIQQNQTLARTFTLETQGSQGAKPSRDYIDVPGHSEKIVLHDRHLDCLLSGPIEYVAISHVWDRSVAVIQNDYSKGLKLSEKYDQNQIEHVASLIRDSPMRIYRGLLKDKEFSSTLHEVWHDYISVPQWNNERKGLIIRSIPRIYQQASLVVPFLSDIEDSTIRAMREGHGMEERVHGIVSFCNAMWFRRMWTAMECVQSTRLRPLLGDYSLVGGGPFDVPFYIEPDKHWEQLEKLQIRHFLALGQPTDPAVEHIVKMAGVGKNILPHMLGPYSLVRTLRLQGKRIPFSHCFSLLSRRQVTQPLDFLHALIALVNPIDPQRFYASLQTVKNCSLRNVHRVAVGMARMRMEERDISALFMMPWKREVCVIQYTGFDEFGLCALGTEEFGLRYTDVIISNGGKPRLTVENIGKVTLAKRCRRSSDLGSFQEMVQLVLTYTGPDPNEFVMTLSCRLFGVYPEAAMAHLAEHDRKSLLAYQLKELYDDYPDVDQQKATDNIADLLGLNSGPPGGYPSEHPIQFMQRHGRVIHSFHQKTMVCVECANCHGRFLMLVGLIFHKPASPSDILGAVAYRVPGLNYESIHREGAGWLVKNNQIVARFLWAGVTCHCQKTEEVEIPFADDWIPEPFPNEHSYGSI